MIIKPLIRRNICINAHPLGCAAQVRAQINYVMDREKIVGPKKVLVIGASNGYGLAARIVSAFASNAATIGLALETAQGGDRGGGGLGEVAPARDDDDVARRQPVGDLAVGEQLLDRLDLAGADRARLRDFRRRVQIVFQDPVGSLNPQMRVVDIVAEPLVVHEPQSSSPERRQRVAAMLNQVGLGAEYLERYPHQLSGGQAQRVAIARALILGPRVLICDEAVAALDGTVREQILRLLRRVQAETGLAIVFITHDLAVVRTISHRVCVMYLGRLVELADNAALFANARHPYTRALISAIPEPVPGGRKQRQILEGDVPSPIDPPSGCPFHTRCPHVESKCRETRPELRPIRAQSGEEHQVACHFDL